MRVGTATRIRCSRTPRPPTSISRPARRRSMQAPTFPRTALRTSTERRASRAARSTWAHTSSRFLSWSPTSPGRWSPASGRRTRCSRWAARPRPSPPARAAQEGHHVRVQVVRGGDRDSEDQPRPPGPAARQALREADEEEPAGEALHPLHRRQASMKRAVAAGATAVPFSGRSAEGPEARQVPRHRRRGRRGGQPVEAEVDRLPGRQALAGRRLALRCPRKAS